METKLSKLNEGDIFKFIGNQKALYCTPNGGRQTLDTQEHIMYLVLKKNPTSVKTKHIDSTSGVEFTFKFKGFFTGNVPGKDCSVFKNND